MYLICCGQKNQTEKPSIPPGYKMVGPLSYYNKQSLIKHISKLNILNILMI